MRLRTNRFASAHGVPATEASMALAEQVNRLLDPKSSLPRSELVAAVDDLRQELLMYFRHQEAALNRIRYPGIEGHITAHARLMHEFERHASAFERSTASLSADFLSFLADWLRSYLRVNNAPHERHD
jgi:hemerythrin-like metal-binding protein